jgi:hypothetical protein
MNKINETDYGFIISRHVTCTNTNNYWNNAIICIRKLYPFRRIVIIDDNSNYTFVKSFFDYKNVTFVQSEFEKCGELLPYYYFHKYKFFKNAVIIHDSVFIHKRVAFEKILGIPCIPLWHFEADSEELTDRNYLVNNLSNNKEIQNKLSFINNKYVIKDNNNKWNGCFGIQSFINLNFLEKIEKKYNVLSLVNYVKTRHNRCALERIFGVIFCIECNFLIYNKSLFGNIFEYCKWGYTFNEYLKDKYNKRIIYRPIVKVWTGR